MAARHNHTSCVKYLCHLKANPNRTMMDMKTPLMYAASHGSVEGITALIECGADLSIEAPPGATALMFAATCGKAEAVKTLVANGAIVDQETQLDRHFPFPMGREKVEVRGSTALICSIASLQDHVSELFLRSLGAAPEYEDKFGQTVLMTAVSANNLSVIKELCVARADPNRMTSQHLTALIHAAWTNKPLAVATLRQMGANPDIESQRFGTALMAAAEAGSIASLDTLLDGEVVATGISRESRRGMTALNSACKANNVDVVKRLCEHKADLNSGTRFDETPIDMCVLFKSLDALRMLLDLRANPDRLNRYKLTSTQMALGSGGKDVIELLVKAYRPNEREQHRMELYNRNKARFNARELAMAENTAYSEAFYAEHDRMWGPHTGYESLL